MEQKYLQGKLRLEIRKDGFTLWRNQGTSKKPDWRWTIDASTINEKGSMEIHTPVGKIIVDIKKIRKIK